MTIPGPITTLIAGIVLTLVSLWYGQHHNLFPLAASQEAPLVDGLFNTMMTIGTGLFLLVVGVLVIAAIRFRYQPGDETDGPPIHGNLPLEIMWTAIPAVIVLGIAIYSFDVYNAEGGLNPMDHSVAHATPSHQMASQPGAAIAAPLSETTQATDPNQQQAEQVLQDPATQEMRTDLPQKRDAPTLGVTSPRIGSTPDQAGRSPQMTVNVTGMQFAWLFTYPATEVVAGELHVPVGREVLLNISANDVIHAFWVPEFRLKQDAVPGRQTELRFTPTRPGDYPIVCAELCGTYHGAMKSRVIVESASDFDDWIKSQQVASGLDLNQAIAFQSGNHSAGDFLAPYTEAMGITAPVIEQLTLNHLSH